MREILNIFFDSNNKTINFIILNANKTNGLTHLFNMYLDERWSKSIFVKLHYYLNILNEVDKQKPW